MPKLKYDEDFPLRVEDFARQGMTNDQIACALGIHRATFYKYLRIYSDLNDALKKGKAPIDFEVENKLLKRAQGYEYEEVMVEYKPGKSEKGEQKPTATLIRKTKKQIVPDVLAQIFWLKNRRPKLWREKHDLNLTSQTIIKVISAIPRPKNMKRQPGQNLTGNVINLLHNLY